LQHHPDRAKIALLAAAGLLQNGHDGEAKQFIRLSRDWGVSKKLIIQILIAGVHNSIGRAAAIGNQQHRALQHFENSITIGTPGCAKDLFVDARANNQLEALNLQHVRRDLASSVRIQVTHNTQVALNSAVKYHKSTAVIRVDESKVAEQCARLPPEDFINATFDIQKVTPTRNVIVILSTPRSGSTLFCDVLRKNGMCLPHEYFQPFEYLPLLAQRWECLCNNELIPAKFVEQLCRFRTFANGWLGINLHGSHIPVFRFFSDYFPDVHFHYIHLFRRDLVAQAVSFCLAEQTGMWSGNFRPRDDQRVPEYDFKAIEAATREIEQQNLLIRAFVAAGNLKCREVVYEDLVAGSRELGEYLAALFGTTVAVEFRTDLRKQGSSLNDVWRKMYCRQLLEKKHDARIGLIDFT
jgi:LPS sulfotransferase NodH